MNLVKLQEDLKGMPLQALQQYVNGANPEIPPYLAAAEMQRREATMQRAQMAQGAAQGPQPSVKEQLEQKLGLGALQAQQQQQAMQQVAQQAGRQPMPVPPGAPQPEPQAEPPVMMARGGLAGLPVRDSMFAYANGGVIGYQAGGSMYQQAYQQGEQKGSIYDRNFGQPPDVRRRGEEERRRAQLEARLARAEEALAQPDVNPTTAQALEAEIRSVRAELATLGAGADQSDARFARGPSVMGITDMPPAKPSAPMTPAAPVPPVGEQRAPAPAPRRPAGLPAALPGAATTGMEATAQGIMQESMRAVPEATAQEGIADEQAFARAYGLDQPRFSRTRQTMEETARDYEARKGKRGLEGLMATLGGFSQGYGGAAAGYLSALEAQRAQDDAYNKLRLELERELEGEELGLAKERYGTAGTKLGERREIQRGRERERGETARAVTKAEQERREKELDRRNRLREAGIRGAGRDASLTNEDRARLKSIETDLKDARTRLQKTIGDAKKAPIQAEIDDLVRQRDMLLGIEPPKKPALENSGTQATGATKSKVIDFNSI